MPALKKGGAAASGAAGGAGSNAESSETEWLDGMATMVGWMYEHCSRYQLDEACQGLIQSAERRLNLAQEKIMAKADPFSPLKRWLEKGKYTNALQEFEFICPEQMDRSPNSVFTKTLNGIKVQIALDALRGETQDFEEFRSNVNKLFPTRKKMNAEEARIVDKIRADLLTVTRSSQVAGLLSKQGTEKFKEIEAEFWEELKKHRAATVLEVVLSDVSDGTYQPRVSLHVSAERPSAPEQEQSAGAASSQEPPAAAVHPTSQPSAPPAAPQPVQKPPAAVPRDVTEARRSTAEEAPAAAAAQEDAQFVLSAWDLRKALIHAGNANNEGDFAEIHQQTHPDVKDFLAARRKGKQQPAAQARQPAAARVSEPEPQPAKRKRGRAVEAEADEEVEEEEEEEEEEEHAAGGGGVAAVAAMLQAKRKKEGGGAARGGRSRAAAAARESEKENEQPVAASPGGGKGKVARARDPNESHDAVKQLRGERGKLNLMSVARDPLHEARKISKTANHTSDQNGAKRIRLSPSSPGQKIAWDSDEGSGDEQRFALPSPKDLGYKPGRLSRGSGAAAAGPASSSRSSNKNKYSRWTDEEVENLKAGVKRFQEGKWEEILDGFKFHKTRTATNLKDKWRNLKKYNHI